MIALTVLSLLLMVMDHRNLHLKPLRETLSLTVAPIQYAVDWPFKTFRWIESSVSSHQTLVSESTHYQAQILLLRARLQKFTSIEKENSQLRALLQTYPRGSDRVLVAQLMAVDSDPFNMDVILNKGSDNGAYQGQPVLDANGVFGQVTQVSPITSRVMLITSPLSAVPVQDSRNGVRGIVVGNGTSGTLSLMHMPATQDVKIGDLLETSGLGRRYPVGYPVGVVASVGHHPGHQFSTIYVIPTAHITRARLVLLVWPAPIITPVPTIEKEKIEKPKPVVKPVTKSKPTSRRRRRRRRRR